jgi:hypothetical protein
VPVFYYSLGRRGGGATQYTTTFIPMKSLHTHKHILMELTNHLLMRQFGDLYKEEILKMNY